ncbi:hypothetical protein YC2023_091083 [Brassica napus]
MRDTIGLHVKLLLYWVTFFRFFFKLVQELYCLQMRYSYQPPSMSMLTDLTPIGLALEVSISWTHADYHQETFDNLKIAVKSTKKLCVFMLDILGVGT